MIYEIFTLLVLFQVKHWVCDYPLQTPYMLKKFQLEGWVHPLFCHAKVHALGTLLISASFLWYTSDMSVQDYLRLSVWLMFLDGVVHFVVDRIKAHPILGGRYQMDNPKFWWSLGADQAAHHLTHYFIIVTLIISVS